MLVVTVSRKQLQSVVSDALREQVNGRECLVHVGPEGDLRWSEYKEGVIVRFTGITIPCEHENFEWFASEVVLRAADQMWQIKWVD